MYLSKLVGFMVRCFNATKVEVTNPLAYYATFYNVFKGKFWGFYFLPEAFLAAGFLADRALGLVAFFSAVEALLFFSALGTLGLVTFSVLSLLLITLS